MIGLIYSITLARLHIEGGISIAVEVDYQLCPSSSLLKSFAISVAALPFYIPGNTKR